MKSFAVAYGVLVVVCSSVGIVHACPLNSSLHSTTIITT